MSIKIIYIQSNIFIASAAYLYKSFYRISFSTKRLQKKKFLLAGGSWLFFISLGAWIGKKQLFKFGLMYHFEHIDHDIHLSYLI